MEKANNPKTNTQEPRGGMIRIEREEEREKEMKRKKNNTKW